MAESQQQEIIEQARARRTMQVAPAIARDLRRQAGLSQKDVGEALGVTRVTVHRWETGQRTPQGARAHQYLAFLRRAAREVAG